MKKKFSLLVLLCVFLLPLVSFTVGTEYGRGDVNRDGKVDMDDLTCLINYLMTDKWPEDPRPPYDSKTFYLNGVGFMMQRIEGGTFTMGATEEQTENAVENEYPAHEVTVSSFYISQIQVTRQLWLEVMGSIPHNYAYNFCNPVTWVTWNECQEFITKLNQRMDASFRLPTEAEWEYAARGGNLSNGFKYAGSNNIDEVGWCSSNSGMSTHNVAMKKENELGLFDMSGNVFEWCQDFYGNYSSEPQTNPTGPESGSFHVLRGGSYYEGPNSCRVSYRAYNFAGSSYWYIGFRLAMSCDD